MPKTLQYKQVRTLTPCDEEAPKPLRYYQDEDMGKAVQALLAGQERVVLWWGTGLGKSLEAKVIASEILASENNPFTHILIVAPQSNIVKQFRGKPEKDNPKKYKQEKYKRVGKNGVVRTTPEVVAVTSDDTPKLFDVLGRFLTAPKKSNILVVTHQLFVKAEKVLMEEFKRGSKKRLLLIPDEKHHAATKGTDLGDLETNLIEQGSTASCGLTATNFRADRKPPNTREITWNEYTSGFWRDGSQVSIKDTLVLERTLPEMMLRGFAPERLEFELVQSDNLTLRDLPDSESDQEMLMAKAEKIGGLAQEVVDIWDRHGRVPTVSRSCCFCPASTNEDLRVAQREAFKKEPFGVDVVDAIGFGGNNKLTDLIEKERITGVTYSDIQKNPVILAIQRATEGLDSPCRCLGISIGIPQSEVLSAQLPGRLMRLRLDIELDENGKRDYSKTAVPTIKGYPEKWQGVSKQVYITAPQKESSPYLMGLLSTLATMVGLSNISLIISVFKKHGILNELNHDVTDTILKNQVKPKEALHARLLVGEALKWWESVKTEDDADVNPRKLARVYEKFVAIPKVEEAGKKYIEVDDQALNEAIIQRLMESTDSPKLDGAFIRRTRARDPNNPDLLEELDALCEEFKIKTQSDSLHNFGSVDLVYWGSKFGGISSKCIPKSMSDMEQYYDNFLELNERCPDILDKLTPSSTYTFATCHSFLKRGAFGPVLVGGLRQWAIKRKYGELWREKLDKWTDHYHEVVAANREAFRESHGRRCPVYKYLRRLVGKKLPEGLTLEEACALVSGESSDQ